MGNQMTTCTTTVEDTSTNRSSNTNKLAYPEPAGEAVSGVWSMNSNPKSSQHKVRSSVSSQQGTRSSARETKRLELRESGYSPHSSGLKAAGRTSSASGGPKARVLVHPINVGQGDAILLEVQHRNGRTERHLIDGGKENKTRYKKEHYENLLKALRAKECLRRATGRGQPGTLEDRHCEQVHMDSIVITHPDDDHIGGINRLLFDFTVTCPITTTEATCVYVGNIDAKVAGQRIGDEFIVPSHDLDLVKHSFPVQGRQHTYIKTLPTGSTVNLGKNPNFNGDDNASSVLTTVSLPGSNYDYDAVLTGDSNAGIIQHQLNIEGKTVGVFQVPHHGSRYNYYSKEPATIRECANFYSQFRADIYFISHGKHGSYNHPHKEVLTGILSAAVENKHHCKLVVTASWFERSKIDDTGVKNWREYVKIYYFKNDVAFVTLNPAEGDVPDGLQLYTHIEKVPSPLSAAEKSTDPNLKQKVPQATPASVASNAVHTLPHPTTAAKTSSQPAVSTTPPQHTCSPTVQTTTSRKTTHTRANTPPQATSSTPYASPRGKEHTPIREPPHPQPATNVQPPRRRLQFTEKGASGAGSDTLKECCICKHQVASTDRLYRCSNWKCRVVTHLNCEEEARKTRRFVKNFSKCEHCRTCKECMVVMGTARVMCKSCDCYAHLPCIRKVEGQSKEYYTCKECRTCQ